MKIFRLLLIVLLVIGCSLVTPKPTNVIEEKQIYKEKPIEIPKKTIYVATKPEPSKVIPPAQKNIPKPEVPQNSLQFFPFINELLDLKWETLRTRSVIPSVVEQETCITLKHKSCWNPQAQLKTSREYGFGLGQLTIAYNANGTERFNNFMEIKKFDSELKKWQWSDRFNPKYQLRALIVQYRNHYNSIKWTDDELNRLAFADSAYNGGLGGVLQDRKKTATNGGNPNLWFGNNNVAANSYKAKITTSGYGKSFYQINREHVNNVINVRRFKYIPYVEK
jgi:hypothetical protein